MKQKRIIGLLFILFFGISGLGLFTVVEKKALQIQVEEVSKEEAEFVTIKEFIPEEFIGRRTICGTDDRVPSYEAAIGRIRNLGASNIPCTGWIAETGVLVTAGHCVSTILSDGNENVIEFNVKLSDSNGDMNDSDPEEIGL